MRFSQTGPLVLRLQSMFETEESPQPDLSSFSTKDAFCERKRVVSGQHPPRFPTGRLNPFSPSGIIVGFFGTFQFCSSQMPGWKTFPTFWPGQASVTECCQGIHRFAGLRITSIRKLLLMLTTARSH